MDDKKLWQAQADRFFPRYTPAWNPVIHLLADLGVGSNEVARRLGITNPNVARWRKPYEDGGRPIPDKYLPQLYDMLREAVAVAEQVLAAYTRQEGLKPSAVLDESNLHMARYNRRAQLAEFERVIKTAKLELGEL
jgi:transposase-like protein